MSGLNTKLIIKPPITQSIPIVINSTIKVQNLTRCYSYLSRSVNYLKLVAERCSEKAHGVPPSTKLIIISADPLKLVPLMVRAV